MRFKLSDLKHAMTKDTTDKQELLRQGIKFYETAREAIFQGKLSDVDLHRRTGWTVEHYEYFKLKLANERTGAETRMRKVIDQRRNDFIDEIKQLYDSIR